MSVTDVLDDMRRRFAPSYGDGLTNHLPMAAVALAHLGASEERIRALVETLAPRLEPARPWPAAEAFALVMQQRGVDVVLRERLKRDLVGLAGGAFHGAIRLAYATMTKDVKEIAHGLAYLEDMGQPIEVPSRPSAVAGSNDINELAERLRERAIAKPTGPNLTVRLAQVVADERFIDVANALVVDHTTLRQVSGAGARWYLAADDFASMHVLTGAHAVRVLRAWTVDKADERDADRALALAALAMFVVCGSPARAEARNRPKLDDKDLKKLAIASDDDHMAKLVVSALAEEQAHEDAIYRIVASRAAKRGHT